MTGNGKTALPVRRSPFRPFEELFPLLNERWPLEMRFPFGRTLKHEVETPALDMYEKDGQIVVKAELPGIAADQIEVTVTGNELKLSGERKEEKEVREEDYFHSERTYGRIFRSVVLPDGVDTDAVTATVKDGVVEVTLPRKQAAATKKIEVKTA
jgi:HSP20 family protein